MPSLPELVTSEEQVSVTAKEVIALRLAYISAVLGAIDTSTDEAQLPSIALKILLTDSQIRAVSQFKYYFGIYNKSKYIWIFVEQ